MVDGQGRQLRVVPVLFAVSADLMEQADLFGVMGVRSQYPLAADMVHKDQLSAPNVRSEPRDSAKMDKVTPVRCSAPTSMCLHSALSGPCRFCFCASMRSYPRS